MQNNIEIRYAKHIDIVFHALAYLQVNNASNCYCQKYIDEIAAIKRRFQGCNHDISHNMNLLQGYYNTNFERLGLINFLPFYSRNYEELKDIFMNCTQFSADDKIYFIEPFIKILNNENEFYFDYWDSLHEKDEPYRKSVEQNLVNEFEKYSCVFDYYNKSVLIFLSYSMTKNGRGFYGNEGYFGAFAPFPEYGNINAAFFQLLHELTHTFTDTLLPNINMNDDSHNLSEYMVILADYYLIKAIDKNNILEYFKWLASGMNRENVELTEELFLTIFKVDDEIHAKLKRIINNIFERAL